MERGREWSGNLGANVLCLDPFLPSYALTSSSLVVPHLPYDFCSILLPRCRVSLLLFNCTSLACLHTYLHIYMFPYEFLPFFLLLYNPLVSWIIRILCFFVCVCVFFVFLLARLISSLCLYHHRHLHSSTSSWSSFVLFPGFLLWIRNHGRGAGSGQELEGRASSSHLYRPDCCCQAGAGFVGASGSASLSLRWPCSVTSDWEVSKYFWFYFISEEKEKERKINSASWLFSHLGFLITLFVWGDCCVSRGIIGYCYWTVHGSFCKIFEIWENFQLWRLDWDLYLGACSRLEASTLLQGDVACQRE